MIVSEISIPEQNLLDAFKSLNMVDDFLDLIYVEDAWEREQLTIGLTQLLTVRLSNLSCAILSLKIFS